MLLHFDLDLGFDAQSAGHVILVGRPLGFLELGRAGAEWYARSEHTAGWVRLPPGAATLREQAERLEAGTTSTPR